MNRFFALAVLVILAQSKEEKCGEMEYWDRDACQCFAMHQCMPKCGYNTVQDPRKHCSCADAAEVEALYDHPDLDANCNPILEASTLPA